MKQSNTALLTPSSRVPTSLIIVLALMALVVILVILEAVGAASLSRTIGLFASFVNGRRWSEWLDHLVLLGSVVSVGALMVAAARRSLVEKMVPWVIALLSGVVFVHAHWAAALGLAIIIGASIVARRLGHNTERASTEG